MTPTAKKATIIVAGLGATSAVLYFLFKDSPGKLGQFIRGLEREAGTGENVEYKAPPAPPSEVANTNTGGSSSSYPCNSYISEKFPIAKGMKGSVSKKIQETLNKRYGEKLAVDGCYGKLTEAAVKRALGVMVVSTDNYLVLLGKDKATSNFSLIDPSTWLSAIGDDII